MKLNRLFSLALAVLLLLPALAACNGNGTGEATTAAPDDLTVAGNADAVIVKDGASEYSILRADTEDDQSAAAGAALRRAIQALGAEISIVTDWVKSGDTPPEIGKTLVVGKVRDSKAEAVWSALGESDYTVTERDGAVYIVGGSQIATFYAWLHFRDTFIDGEAKTAVVPAGYEYTFRGSTERGEYIENPDLFLVNWIDEFQAPEWMTSYEKTVEALGTPDGRMMSSAHRGDFVHYPENSIEGIISCIRMGCDNIELDFRLSKDGVVVFMHDETLTRTTDWESKKGKNGLPTSNLVSDWTYEQLMQLNLRMNNKTATEYKIPTLDEALKVCNGRITIRVDKMTGLADWKAYVWPAMVKNEAYAACILNYHIDLGDAISTMRLWSKQTGGKIPFYFGKINNSNLANWGSLDTILKQYDLLPLVRWSDFNPNSDLVNALALRSDYLALAKGKLRIYVDAHQNSSQETPQMWDRLLDGGVNFILVNDPLALCKYIAEKYDATGGYVVK